MSGKDIRLKRLMNPNSDRICVFPMDHGTTLGPIDGIQNYVETLDQVIDGGADAVVVHKGLLKKVGRHPKLIGANYIMHASVSTILSPNPGEKSIVATVEEAVQLGADAVSIHVNLGVESEAKMIKDFGEIEASCSKWGMPLLAMMYAEPSQMEHYHLAHAARLAEEMGADIIKIGYPESIDELERIVNSVQVPVIMSGGEKVSDPRTLLSNIDTALKLGVKGVAIGRNIFQHENPKLMMKAIKCLVHNEMTLQECLKYIDKGAC